MLSKIPTASALGGQFWIKDSPGIAGCVPELDGAVCFALCLLRPGRLQIVAAACFLPGHSVASGVLRELFKVIQPRGSCQATFAYFLDSRPALSEQRLRYHLPPRRFRRSFTQR